MQNESGEQLDRNLQVHGCLSLGGSQALAALAAAVIPLLAPTGEAGPGFLSYCLVFLYVLSSTFAVALLVRAAYWRFSNSPFEDSTATRIRMLLPIDVVGGLGVGALATGIYDINALIGQDEALLFSVSLALVSLLLTTLFGLAFNKPPMQPVRKPDKG